MRDPEQHYTALLGEEFGRIYNAVSSEWCQALVRLEEIETLFGSQEKCDTLNRLAPPFFADVQKLFWNDLMLRVTRLTDRSRRSVRVQSLERFLEKDSALLKQVRGHREAAARAAAPIAVRRNQVIAHYQQSRALERAPQPLPSVTLNWSYPAFTDGWFLGLMVSDVVSFLPRHFTERGKVHRGRGEQPGEVRSASVAPALHLRFRPHG